MPVYEFRCGSCGKLQDRLLPPEQRSRPGTCDACDGPLRRLYSRVGVRLEGWGFSRTDGLVPQRPGRGDFRAVRERAERISEGDP